MRVMTVVELSLCCTGGVQNDVVNTPLSPNCMILVSLFELLRFRAQCLYVFPVWTVCKSRSLNSMDLA